MKWLKSEGLGHQNLSLQTVAKQSEECYQGSSNPKTRVMSGMLKLNPRDIEVFFKKNYNYKHIFFKIIRKKNLL